MAALPGWAAYLTCMGSLFRTTDLPAADRFEFLREAVAEVWVPMDLRSEHQADYRAQIRTSELGAIQVSVANLQPITVNRTPALIREADPDLLKVVGLVRGTGSGWVSQGGRQARLKPGDFTVYDTRRPYELAYGPGGNTVGETLIFMFPRSLLHVPPSRLNQLTAVPMPTGPGIGTLASRFLLELAHGIDHYGPAEAARLATAALDVLAARLAHELDDQRRLPPETHKRALLARVHAFIHARLSDPDLSPSMIAAAHHISLRSLHALFQENGITVAGTVRRRRLESAARDLADPELSYSPVAAIAARWGFLNAAHFTQAFKAAYGMPPRDYRQGALRTDLRGS